LHPVSSRFFISDGDQDMISGKASLPGTNMKDGNAIGAGDIAPDFTLPATGPESLVLSSLRPGRVVLFFYPKDDTSGCTKEAMGFSEMLERFKAADCEVIGISRDTLSSHVKFRAKHGLSTILASDGDGTVCRDYGVWKEKKMYGKTFWGIERSTFLIGSEGVIEGVWRKVRVPGHVEEVLQALEAT